MTADGVFVHPNALVESAAIGAGTRVWAFAHVMKGAVVGAACNVGDHAFVEDGAVIGDRVTLKNGVAVWQGVTLEDDVFVGPFAVFTNDLVPRSKRPWTMVPTLVRQGASIGANATIVCGITIGRYAMVGAGAVVTKDVPDHTLVVGCPARPVGVVCVCGRRLPEGETPTCAACGFRHVP